MSKYSVGHRSKTSVQIATDDAHRAFNEGNDHIESSSFMVATIVARRYLEADVLSLGLCLADDLSTRQKALIFKRIADDLAALAVEEDIAANLQDTQSGPIAAELTPVHPSPQQTLRGAGVASELQPELPITPRSEPVYLAGATPRSPGSCRAMPEYDNPRSKENVRR